MRLGRSSVIMLGLLFLLTVIYTGQAISYFRKEVSVGVVTGYKQGKTCVEFETEVGVVEVCRDLPRHYLTGDDAVMIYDPAHPAEADLDDLDYWLDNQYLPVFFIVAWLVFSASYFHRGEVLIISFKGKLFRKEDYNKGRYYRGNRNNFF